MQLWVWILGFLKSIYDVEKEFTKIKRFFNYFYLQIMYYTMKIVILLNKERQKNKKVLPGGDKVPDNNNNHHHNTPHTSTKQLNPNMLSFTPLRHIVGCSMVKAPWPLTLA